MIRWHHRIFFINFCNKVIASGDILCASLAIICDIKLHLFIISTVFSKFETFSQGTNSISMVNCLWIACSQNLLRLSINLFSSLSLMVVRTCLALRSHAASKTKNNTQIYLMTWMMADKGWGFSVFMSCHGQLMCKHSMRGIRGRHWEAQGRAEHSAAHTSLAIWVAAGVPIFAHRGK